MNAHLFLFLLPTLLLLPEVHPTNLTFTLPLDPTQSELLTQLLTSALKTPNEPVPLDPPITVNCSIEAGQLGVQLQLVVNGIFSVIRKEQPELGPGSLEREWDNAVDLGEAGGRLTDLETTTSADLLNATPTARLAAIKSLAKTAWINLISYKPSWPPLTPRDKLYIDFVNGELIAAMSTLHLMELQEEFAQGRRRIEENLNLTDKALKDWQLGKPVHQEHDLVYNVVNKYLGGLLSCYALTEDPWFLDKSKEVADFLEPAYVKIPDWYHPSKGYHLDYDAMFNQQLEYRYLSDLAGDSKYWDRLGLIQHAAIDYQKMADSDLRNKVLKRLKSYIQSNRQDRRGIEDYINIIEEATDHGQFAVTRSGLTYFQRARGWTSMNDQRHSFGAMLALGASAQKAILDSRFLDTAERRRWLDRMGKHTQLAEAITETFYLATRLTGTGLPPADFKVNAYALDQESSFGNFQGEAIEAYLAESYLVLYRTTKDPKYRTWAWDLVKAISVNGTADKDYRLPNSMYLSATLKYLWLIFSEDDVLPAGKWISNEAGQMMPVCGGDEKVWPIEKCAYKLMSYQEKLVAQFDL